MNPYAFCENFKRKPFCQKRRAGRTVLFALLCGVALVFGPANKKFGAVNAWLSSDAAEVERYIYDPLCGYIFTNNGFLNLFKLQKSAFEVSGWSIGNADLPILLIAGADDPVIQGEKKFFQLKAFLKQVGYQNISTKLYSNMRHELLNETGRQEVYRDILSFLE